jgi:hypothetical protein
MAVALKFESARIACPMVILAENALRSERLALGEATRFASACNRSCACFADRVIMPA